MLSVRPGIGLTVPAMVATCALVPAPNLSAQAFGVGWARALADTERGCPPQQHVPEEPLDSKGAVAIQIAAIQKCHSSDLKPDSKRYQATADLLDKLTARVSAGEVTDKNELRAIANLLINGSYIHCGIAAEAYRNGGEKLSVAVIDANVAVTKALRKAFSRPGQQNPFDPTSYCGLRGDLEWYGSYCGIPAVANRVAAAYAELYLDCSSSASVSKSLTYFRKNSSVATLALAFKGEAIASAIEVDVGRKQKSDLVQGKIVGDSVDVRVRRIETNVDILFDILDRLENFTSPVNELQASFKNSRASLTRLADGELRGVVTWLLSRPMTPQERNVCAKILAFSIRNEGNEGKEFGELAGKLGYELAGIRGKIADVLKIDDKTSVSASRALLLMSVLPLVDRRAFAERFCSEGEVKVETINRISFDALCIALRTYSMLPDQSFAPLKDIMRWYLEKGVTHDEMVKFGDVGPEKFGEFAAYSVSLCCPRGDAITDSRERARFITKYDALFFSDAKPLLISGLAFSSDPIQRDIEQRKAIASARRSFLGGYASTMPVGEPALHGEALKGFGVGINDVIEILRLDLGPFIRPFSR